MNKVFVAFCRKRNYFLPSSSLYYRQIFETEGRFLSSVCEIQKQKHQHILPVQSVSCIRHMGFLSRLKKNVRSFISDNTKIKVGGCLAYEKIADTIDYNQFFKYIELPDTFHSWFLVLELHMYLTILVTASEKHGRSFRNGLVDNMWSDVEIRLDKLTKMTASQKKKYLKDIVSQFNAALISYDEGILQDDKALAASCWRLLFSYKLVDPEKLEYIVLYIRKQLNHLDSQNVQDIIFGGSITFLSLESVISSHKDVLI